MRGQHIILAVINVSDTLLNDHSHVQIDEPFLSFFFLMKHVSNILNL